MDTVSAPQPQHRLSVRRVALVGGGGLGALCLLFWATAAAETLPPATPEWLRRFTPAAGLQILFMGLVLTELLGSLTFALGGALYLLIKRWAGAAQGRRGP